MDRGGYSPQNASTNDSGVRRRPAPGPPRRLPSRIQVAGFAERAIRPGDGTAAGSCRRRWSAPMPARPSISPAVSPPPGTPQGQRPPAAAARVQPGFSQGAGGVEMLAHAEHDGGLGFQVRDPRKPMADAQVGVEGSGGPTKRCRARPSRAAASAAPASAPRDAIAGDLEQPQSLEADADGAVAPVGGIGRPPDRLSVARLRRAEIRPAPPARVPAALVAAGQDRGLPVAVVPGRLEELTEVPRRRRRRRGPARTAALLRPALPPAMASTTRHRAARRSR